jgi:hypothetical protein
VDQSSWGRCSVERLPLISDESLVHIANPIALSIGLNVAHRAMRPGPRGSRTYRERHRLEVSKQSTNRDRELGCGNVGVKGGKRAAVSLELRH